MYQRNDAARRNKRVKRTIRATRAEHGFDGWLGLTEDSLLHKALVQAEEDEMSRRTQQCLANRTHPDPEKFGSFDAFYLAASRDDGFSDDHVPSLFKFYMERKQQKSWEVSGVVGVPTCGAASTISDLTPGTISDLTPGTISDLTPSPIKENTAENLEEAEALDLANIDDLEDDDLGDLGIAESVAEDAVRGLLLNDFVELETPLNENENVHEDPPTSKTQPRQALGPSQHQHRVPKTTPEQEPQQATVPERPKRPHQAPEQTAKTAKRQRMTATATPTRATRATRAKTPRDPPTRATRAKTPRDPPRTSPRKLAPLVGEYKKLAQTKAVQCGCDPSLHMLSVLVPFEKEYFLEGYLSQDNYPSECASCGKSLTHGKDFRYRKEVDRTYCCKFAVNHVDHCCTFALCPGCKGKYDEERKTVARVLGAASSPRKRRAGRH